MTSISIIPQRLKMDCGIAALAMLLGRTYEDVYTAAHCVRRCASTHGVGAKHMVAIAKIFGVTLKRSRAFDLETDCGILSVRGPRNWWHYVVLFAGVVVDPDAGRVSRADDYLATTRGRACSLLITIT